MGRERSGVVRDAVIPAALAVLAAVELILLDVTRLPAAIAAESAACALLVLRRRWTLPACTAAGLFLVLLPYLGPRLDEPAAPILIAGLASFSLARYLPLRRGLAGMAAIFIPLVITQQMTVSSSQNLSDVVFLLAVLAPPYAFGWVMRRLDDSHRTQTRLLLQRQEAVRREAAADERTRIARELHDVLAHTVSAMVVQAEAASELVPYAPDRAVAALHDVTTVGRTALAQIGQLLRLIRDSDDELGLSPCPGLGQLSALVDSFRSGGLRVDLVVEGSVDALPTGVDLAGYRVVQEALTNALKYSSDRAVSLTVRRTPETLMVRTTNRTGAPRRVDGTAGGLGLVGMRERVSVFGGTLSHRIDPDAGFTLTATFPLASRP